MSIKSISKIRRNACNEAPQKKLSFRIPKRLGEGETKKKTNSSNRPSFHSLYKSKSERIISNTNNCSPRIEEGHRITGRQINQPFGVFVHSLIKKNRTKISARKRDISSSKEGPYRRSAYNVTSTGCPNNNDLYQYQSRSDATSTESSGTTSNTRLVRSSSNKVKNKRLQLERGALQRDSSRTFPISAEESDNEELELRTSIAIDNVQPSTTNDHDIHQHVSQSPPHEESVLSCSSSSNTSPTPPTTRPLHHRDFIQEELDFEETYLNNSDTATQKCNKNDTKSSYDEHDCDLPYCKVDRSHPDHYPAFLASASALSPSSDHNTKSPSRSRFTRDSYLLHQSYKHQEEHSSHDGLTMSMPRSVRQVIQSLKGNDRCFECGTRRHLSHAFVPLGIVICDECSYDEMEYANEGDILSFEYDFDWRHHEIVSVLEGGNDAFRRYLRDNCEGNGEIWVLRDEALYDDVKLSVTALRYRKMLEERVRSVTTALGEQNRNASCQTIRFNTSQSLEDEEEYCWSSSIFIKKFILEDMKNNRNVGKRGRIISMKKIHSARF
ncbi:hypothetical protein CTEN210_01261 [Chaetoceros tenuissimus]|uniref:Arf-GAP domain-containing protein n=1 Tax=Chaetoceros tenuissimus TaxID=426638 RepID=A0AAD3CES5_9STRA|nr:hypothetical protein CTEN210_01261 [Chaetoceros tenuissimus]